MATRSGAPGCSWAVAAVAKRVLRQSGFGIRLRVAAAVPLGSSVLLRTPSDAMLCRAAVACLKYRRLGGSRCTSPASVVSFGRTAQWRTCCLARNPDRIRGPNLDGFWGDEQTSWSNPDACYDNLQFALRIAGPKGDSPAGVISTTPKRNALLRAIMADPATVVTRSTTFDNSANLDPATLDFLQRKYGGSTLGRQELLGGVA